MYLKVLICTCIYIWNRETSQVLRVWALLWLALLCSCASSSCLRLEIRSSAFYPSACSLPWYLHRKQKQRLFIPFFFLDLWVCGKYMATALTTTASYCIGHNCKQLSTMGVSQQVESLNSDPKRFGRRIRECNNISWHWAFTLFCTATSEQKKDLSGFDRNKLSCHLGLETNTERQHIKWWLRKQSSRFACRLPSRQFSFDLIQ